MKGVRITLKKSELEPMTKWLSEYGNNGIAALALEKLELWKKGNRYGQSEKRKLPPLIWFKEIEAVEFKQFVMQNKPPKILQDKLQKALRMKLDDPEVAELNEGEWH